MRLPNRRVIAGLAGLAALQGGAHLLYRFVDSGRASKRQGGFSYDEMSDQSLGEALAFEKANGEIFSFGLGERPMVLHFWATWCAPCRTELPTLLAGFKAAETASPQLLLASVDENWETIRHYFGSDLPPQVVRDPQGRLSQTLGVGTLPETWLLRRDGRAVARVRGARDWQSTEARDAVAALVGAKA